MIPFKLYDIVDYTGPTVSFKGKHGIIVDINSTAGAGWPVKVHFTDGPVTWCCCENLKLRVLNYPNLF